MKIINLTEDEREKFASWLEMEAEVSSVIARQMRNLGPPFTSLAVFTAREANYCEALVKRLRANMR